MTAIVAKSSEKSTGIDRQAGAIMTATPAELHFTRFTALKPARLSKRFALAGGTLIKESGGNLTDGIAERLTVNNPSEFAALLQTLTPRQALSYGVNGHDRARIVAKDATPPAGNDLPVINRTRDHFRWPEGAGLLMLDYDPAPDGNPLSVNELHAALATACPALADAPAVWRPSASSCIHDRKTGAALRGVGGQRLYVSVQDAADISRAGDVLFKRLWLAGLGRYEISKSGALLARSVIDASVFQPERLDFCGGAECGRGLEQRLPDPLILNSDAPYLETHAALPDLTTDEELRLTDIRAELATTLEPERQRVREKWIEERVAAGLADLPEERREVERPQLEATYRQAAEGGRLGLDFELTVVPKGSRTRKTVTVADLLRYQARYHEATTTDPLEPDYPDGQARLVGWLNLRAREPYLQSQAHGGIRYWLGDAPQTAEMPPDDDGYLDAVVADCQSDYASGQLVRPLKMKHGEVSATYQNAARLLQSAPFSESIAFNRFAGRLQRIAPVPWNDEPGDWSDIDTSRLMLWAAEHHDVDFTADAMERAISVIADDHAFNPAQDRLKALAAQWDGASRLATWLAEYLNAELTPTNREYLAEIGAAWLKGVAARVLKPGCKRDDVLVQVGPQGYRKSTAAAAIANCISPNSFTDSLGNLGSDEAAIGVIGTTVAEFSELSAIARSELEAVKAFVSRSSDRFREKYARHPTDHPRTCSFIATTNEDCGFLRDPSGNRRWWPVTITAPIDISRLESDLPQLLGEAARRVIEGEPWYVTDTVALTQADEIREDNSERDVWETAVLAAMEVLLPHERTIAKVLGHIGVKVERQDRQATNRVSGILRANGFKKKRGRISGGGLGYVWSLFPSSNGGEQEGNTGLASQQAGCSHVPICSPHKKNNYLEEETGGVTADTTHAANSAVKSAGDLHREIEGNKGNKGNKSPPVDTHPGPDISRDIPIAPPAETQGTPDTCTDKRPDIARADPRRSAPPVCLPSTGYPFRYVTKCDRPTPIMPESGYGDPVGCSHCGERWGARP